MYGSIFEMLGIRPISPGNSTFEPDMPKAKLRDPIERHDLDLDLLQWKAVYPLSTVKMSIIDNHHSGQEILIVEAEGYHREEYPYWEIWRPLIGRFPPKTLTVKEQCMIIFEYLIENALFPYPMEELV